MASKSDWTALKDFYDIFGRLRKDMNPGEIQKHKEALKKVDLKQSEKVHKEGWSGEANVWLFRIFQVAGILEFFAWVIGFFFELYLIFGSTETSDLLIALEGFAIVIPETLFWFYGLWVWIKGTFGHRYLRMVGLTYVLIVMIGGLLCTVWLIAVGVGATLFGGGGAGLLSAIENFAKKQLIIVFPFILIIEFHKLVWLVYYIKYYWVDNRKKTDERLKLN